jgi:hypothetical protein
LALNLFFASSRRNSACFKARCAFFLSRSVSAASTASCAVSTASNNGPNKSFASRNSVAVAVAVAVACTSFNWRRGYDGEKQLQDNNKIKKRHTAINKDATSLKIWTEQFFLSEASP